MTGAFSQKFGKVIFQAEVGNRSSLFSIVEWIFCMSLVLDRQFGFSTNASTWAIWSAYCTKSATYLVQTTALIPSTIHLASVQYHPYMFAELTNYSLLWTKHTDLACNYDKNRVDVEHLSFSATTYPYILELEYAAAEWDWFINTYLIVISLAWKPTCINYIECNCERRMLPHAAWE